MTQKKLIIINGTMGVGKSTVCKELNKKLLKSVWLDGDWCWMMNPWVVNDETKLMVEDNICYLLRNFLRNTTFEYVIFNWVIHQEEIFDIILSKLTEFEFALYKISLMCSESALKERMLKDNRNAKLTETSLKRLKMYENMDTLKLDTTDEDINRTVKRIAAMIGYEKSMVDDEDIK